MAKSLLERYEQILTQDPTSTVFVELAKALLERNDCQRAIDVCQDGLGHHPTSVVGRVLWGKALIQLGRPAEAMEQFDKAIAIDKENPHAYNLIGEVLLRKGLYRSALPLLRRAVALQPDDGRVRQWFEQTQRALAGGPAPVLSDSTLIDTVQEPSPDAQSIPTEIHQGLTPPGPAAPRVSVADARRETPAAMPAVSVPAPPSPGSPPMLMPVGGPPPDRGATDAFAPPSAAAAPAIAATTTAELPARDGEATITAELPAAKLPPLPVSGPALLDVPAPAVAAPSRPSPPQRPKGTSGLLEEIPELPVPSSGVELPKVELSAQATEAIAKEYERELRERLAQKAEQKSVLATHWIKIAAGAAVTLVVVIGLSVYLHTRSVNRGKNLNDALLFAKKAVVPDTQEGYSKALEGLDEALRMDDGSAEAWALTAYVESILYAEHGGSRAAEDKARAALEKKGVEKGFPALALVSRYRLASGREREALRKEVLASREGAPEIEALAGRILLENGQGTAALKRLKKAVENPSSLVFARAQIALGDYYRQFGDDPHALEFYASAGQLTPKHPLRVLGEAESRLSSGEQLPAALSEVQALPEDGALPEAVQARRALVEGKLLSATGQTKQAIALLTAQAPKFKPQAFEFDLALGEADRLSGNMAAAEDAFEGALKLRPRDEEARVALGRVLLARGRERELLSRLAAGNEDRQLRLLRGEAYLNLKDWRRARSELTHTQVNGRYSAEAVAYLALIDAEVGDPDRAEAVLEKAKDTVRHAKSTVLVALGQIEWQRGQTDAARTHFEQASEDPQEYEAPCRLGRLWLSLGDPAHAVEALEKALARNASDAEARGAMAKALLALGKPSDALAQVQAWKSDDPRDPESDRALAEVELRLGQLPAADSASAQAVRHLSRDVEAHRVRAAVLFAKGEGKKAVAELQRANKLDPKDPVTFCEIGRAFLRMGKADAAEKAYQTAQKLSPDLACAAVGLIAGRLPGEAKVSVRALNELSQRASDSWDKASAEATLARAELALGNTREASRRAGLAIQLAPAFADGYWAQGMIALKSRDVPAARTALARAAALDPGYAAIRLANADALARGDDALDQAIPEYQAFLRLASKSPEEKRVKKLIPTLKKRLASR